MSKLSALLRRDAPPREEDGAIPFWRLKDYLRNDVVHSQHCYDEEWKREMTGGGGTGRDFNIVLIRQEKLFISELLKVILRTQSY